MIRGLLRFVSHVQILLNENSTKERVLLVFLFKRLWGRGIRFEPVDKLQLIYKILLPTKAMLSTWTLI